MRVAASLPLLGGVLRQLVDIFAGLRDDEADDRRTLARLVLHDKAHRGLTKFGMIQTHSRSSRSYRLAIAAFPLSWGWLPQVEPTERARD